MMMMIIIIIIIISEVYEWDDVFASIHGNKLRRERGKPIVLLINIREYWKKFSGCNMSDVVVLYVLFRHTNTQFASTRAKNCFWPAWYNVKGKSKGLDTCYSAIYMSQTRDQ